MPGGALFSHIARYRIVLELQNYGEGYVWGLSSFGLSLCASHELRNGLTPFLLGRHDYVVCIAWSISKGAANCLPHWIKFTVNMFPWMLPYSVNAGKCRIDPKHVSSVQGTGTKKHQKLPSGLSELRDGTACVWCTIQKYGSGFVNRDNCSHWLCL